MFKVFTSKFGSVYIADELFHTVTEGVLHGVYKLVTQSCFEEILSSR